MLSQLEQLGINIGLYRDEYITIEANQKTVDFLDITMNLDWRT